MLIILPFLIMGFYFLVMMLLGRFLLIMVVVVFLAGVVDPFWGMKDGVLLDLVSFFYWGSGIVKEFMKKIYDLAII